MPSGANYAITITNLKCHRCLLQIKIDDHQIPGGFWLNPYEKNTIERSTTQAKKFKFYAIADAPQESGINRWPSEQNGVIEVVFTPEKADMKIICVGAYGMSSIAPMSTRAITCSFETTDSEFRTMALKSFNADCGTILLDGWKPLGNRNMRLIEYGIQDGSRVHVNFGGKGGTIFNPDGSQQGFTNVCHDIELDPMLTASLKLRLVAREGEGVLPSTETCTPLARTTLTPPPVPIY